MAGAGDCYWAQGKVAGLGKRAGNEEVRPRCADFLEDRIKVVGWQARDFGIFADLPDCPDFAALDAGFFIRKIQNSRVCGRSFLFSRFPRGWPGCGKMKKQAQ